MKTPCWIAILAAFALGSALAEHPVRMWTSNDGKSIEAALLHATRESVTLKLRNGREAIVPVERLSEADQTYLAELNATGQAIRVGGMPDESKVDPNIGVEGGPRVFVTPHFTFESDQGVTKAFISEAARVFEGTLAAVGSLPLGIVPKPAEGETRFRTLFLDRSAFEKEFLSVQSAAGPGTLSVQNVAGVYIPGRKEVLVPFSSLGVTKSGSQISLRRSSDTSTLIHEITHQVMHDWLPLVPLWVSEGLAEYMSAVPYQNGRFEFKNAPAGLKETLREEFGIGEGQIVRMRAPGEWIEKGNELWQGGTTDYLSGLMMVYYFIHLDQPEKPCAALAAYLHLLGQSRQDTESFIAQYNAAVRDFEGKRKAYNAEIDAYNAALVKFKSEVAAYNGRVEAYNEQTRQNVSPAERIEVGSEPVPPVAPKPIEVPAILKENADSGGPVDIVRIMHEKARPALYRDREPDALAMAMREAYAKMGISLTIGEGQ